MRQKLIDSLAEIVKSNALHITPDEVVKDAGILLHHSGSLRALIDVKRAKGRLVDADLDNYTNVLTWCNEIASKYGCVVAVDDISGRVDVNRRSIDPNDSPVGDLVCGSLA